MNEKPQRQPFPKEWPERKLEKPVPKVYPIINTDLGRDNVENDLCACDREDLQPDK